MFSSVQFDIFKFLHKFNLYKLAKVHKYTTNTNTYLQHNITHKRINTSALKSNTIYKYEAKSLINCMEELLIGGALLVVKLIEEKAPLPDPMFLI